MGLVNTEVLFCIFFFLSVVVVNIFAHVAETEFQKSTPDGLNREEINKIGTAAAELSLSSFLAGRVDLSVEIYGLSP